MTEIVQSAGSALAIRRDQADWTPEQGQALLEMFNLGNAPHSVIRSYFHVCQTTGLDPFKRQIHLIERQGKFTPQTSIDGFRIIRDRSKVYDGDETFWCGDDGVWTDAWLRSEPPTACKFVLYVKGRSHPVTAVARWSEYVQTKRDGSVTSMWQRMAAHMLAKVAEALAIRKAFPDDTGGLYTDDEMMQADVVNDDGSSQPKGRKRSPGIMDLPSSPEPQLPAEQESPASLGSFMDAGSEDIQDAEVIDDAPEAQPEPVEQTEPVAQVMDTQPEARQEIELVWSKRIAEFCERENPQLHELQALYQEAGAANALGDRVPWVGDPKQGGSNVHDAIMMIRANMEQGQQPLAGLA